MMEGQRFATTWKDPDMIDFHLKVGGAGFLVVALIGTAVV